MRRCGDIRHQNTDQSVTDVTGVAEKPELGSL
jgi:hypothetical protein